MKDLATKIQIFLETRGYRGNSYDGEALLKYLNSEGFYITQLTTDMKRTDEMIKEAIKSHQLIPNGVKLLHKPTQSEYFDRVMKRIDQAADCELFGDFSENFCIDFKFDSSSDELVIGNGSEGIYAYFNDILIPHLTEYEKTLLADKAKQQINYIFEKRKEYRLLKMREELEKL